MMLGFLTALLVVPLLYIYSRSAEAEWVRGGTTYGPVIYVVGQGTVGQNSANVAVGTNTSYDSSACNTALFPSRCANMRGEAPAQFYPSGSSWSSGGTAWSTSASSAW